MLVVGFLFFCLGLIFMFFDSVVVIWRVFVCFLPRKFIGLKAKVFFAGAWFGCWVYGFGCFARDMGLGFG